MSFVILSVIQKSEQKKYIYKLNSDHKILSPLIKKVWCTRIFLNQFKEVNQQ